MCTHFKFTIEHQNVVADKFNFDKFIRIKKTEHEIAGVLYYGASQLATQVDRKITASYTSSIFVK